MSHTYYPWVFTPEEQEHFKKILANLFEYNYAHPSALNREHYTHLKVVLGLGFTAALVDGRFVEFYLERLNIFAYAGQFEAFPSPPPLLLNAIMEMVEYGSKLLAIVGYPAYYDIFKSSLGTLLCGVRMDLLNVGKEAKALHQKLTGFRRF